MLYRAHLDWLAPHDIAGLFVAGGTGEKLAPAGRGVGVDTYSPAVFFNFIPETAPKFYAALTAGDDATCEQMLRDFYYPLTKIRDRKTGHAVSAIKAGMALRGFATGPVRPPLSDLTAEEHDMPGELIDSYS